MSAGLSPSSSARWSTNGVRAVSGTETSGYGLAIGIRGTLPGMDQIPTDMILSEQSVRAGLGAMERIHGRHLGDMSPDEQEQARGHWREQVEQVLAAVREVYGEPPTEDRGYAVITLSDAGED